MLDFRFVLRVVVLGVGVLTGHLHLSWLTGLSRFYWLAVVTVQDIQALQNLTFQVFQIGIVVVLGITFFSLNFPDIFGLLSVFGLELFELSDTKVHKLLMTADEAVDKVLGTTPVATNFNFEVRVFV